MPYKPRCATAPNTVTAATTPEVTGPEGRKGRIAADADVRWKKKGSPEGKYEEYLSEAAKSEKIREHKILRQQVHETQDRKEKIRLAVRWQYAVMKNLWSEEATGTTLLALSDRELRILAAVAMEAADGEEIPILPHPDEILILDDLAEALEASLNVQRRR